MNLIIRACSKILDFCHCVAHFVEHKQFLSSVRFRPPENPSSPKGFMSVAGSILALATLMAACSKQDPSAGLGGNSSRAARPSSAQANCAVHGAPKELCFIC